MNTSHVAERVGFEPTVRENRTPDFESGTFDHSATSPLEVVMVAESAPPLCPRGTFASGRAVGFCAHGHQRFVIFKH